jgi:hypothetical protein
VDPASSSSVPTGTVSYRADIKPASNPLAFVSVHSWHFIEPMVRASWRVVRSTIACALFLNPENGQGHREGTAVLKLEPIELWPQLEVAADP